MIVFFMTASLSRLDWFELSAVGRRVTMVEAASCSATAGQPKSRSGRIGGVAGTDADKIEVAHRHSEACSDGRDMQML
jgi:hypothetical protein